MDESQKPFSVSLDGKLGQGPSKVEGLRGIIPPLVTPLLSDGSLDFEGLGRLIEHVLAGGVHGLFILGTSGESASLTQQLRHEFAFEVCRRVKQRVPVLLGVSDTSVANVRDLTGMSADLGADAVVLSPPYYLPPSQKELFHFARQVASESPVPVYLYNMPELTKTKFEVETIRQLAEVPNIVGLKDSSGNAAYLLEVQEAVRARTDWSLFVGSENLLADSVLSGIHGGVTGGANVWPELLVAIYNAALRSDRQQCRSLQAQLLEFNQIYQFGGYGVGVIRGLKCALGMMGICNDQMAEPFTGCDSAQRTLIERKLIELNRLRKNLIKETREIPKPHFKSPVEDHH